MSVIVLWRVENGATTFDIPYLVVRLRCYDTRLPSSILVVMMMDIFVKRKSKYIVQYGKGFIGMAQDIIGRDRPSRRVSQPHHH